MSDNHQAELLARWLSESGRGEPAPTGLDEDAVEAVLALRPDLAPPARVDIDDILDVVEEGPFAETGEGAALADWLDSGTLSDAIDADVQEAVFALRPGLAAAPRVDMDDIFGAVTTGPFAQDAAPEVAPVVSLMEARQQRASRRRWWAPVGAVAAAAVALLMVNPVVMTLPEPTMDLALEAPSPTLEAKRAPAAEAPVAAAPPPRPSGEARSDARESLKEAPSSGATSEAFVSESEPDPVALEPTSSPRANSTASLAGAAS
ncbi:MAG: hypothetical protein P8R54_16305, partial [Myxococcota bacterium]|nr:hypothetical protein [Myxococcota bacterium]